MSRRFTPRRPATAGLAIIIILIIASLESCTFINDLLALRPRSIPLGDYSYVVEHADRLVRRTMRRLDVPGVVVGLIDDQEVVWHQGYGVRDLDSRAPVTVNTVFKAGSVAKVFTALEVMRLYEEGLVDLDAPLKTYLPDFEIQTRWPEAPPITIRDVLMHRSGLPRNDSLLPWYWEAIPEVFTTIAATGSELHQAYPAGYRYKYSNFGYNVLGRLIEVVRGLVSPVAEAAGGYPYHMESAIFKPLGMDNSGFGSRALLYGEINPVDTATGYFKKDGRNVRYNQFDIIEMASGGLHTTMVDLEAFMHFLFSGDAAPAGAASVEERGQHVIDAETLEEMYHAEYATQNDPQTNGLGWFTDSIQLSEQMVFHDGTNQGAISYIGLLPERKIGLIFLTNADQFEDVQNQLAVEILALMLETKYGIRPGSPNKPDAIDLDASVLSRYEGRYIADDEVIDVVLYSNGLRAKYRGMNLFLKPVATSRFRVTTPIPGIEDVYVTFSMDDFDSRFMILALGGSYHIICPEYPTFDDTAGMPPLWLEIAGTYSISYRHPSTYGDAGPGSVEAISIDDGILQFGDGRTLYPLDETTIKIVGGIYDGEIIERTSDGTRLVWQHLVYSRQ